MNEVEVLASVIRRVDGTHSLGASALAEALVAEGYRRAPVLGSAALTSPGEWRLLHDRPDGENVVVAFDGQDARFVGAFDDVDDARFVIAARAAAIESGGGAPVR